MKVKQFFNYKICMKSIFVLIAFFMALGIELLVFNASYWDMIPKNMNKIDLLPYMVLNESEYFDDAGIHLSGKTAEFKFSEIYVETINIAFDILSEEKKVDVSLFLKDDGNVYGWVEANTVQIRPGGETREIQLELRSKGQIRDIKILLENAEGVVVSNVYLNEKVSFHILWKRVFVIFILCILFIGIWKWNWLDFRYNGKSKMQLGMTCFVMFLCIWFAREVYQGFYGNVEPWKYPFSENEIVNKVEYFTPEIQMFDALKKNMTHVDQYPSNELKKLDNPYDFSERVANVTPFWWDASYYKDNYYFYFGQSVIFIVVVPYYLITGELPATQLTLFILTIISIVGIFFLIRQIMRKFKTNTSYILYIFFNCVVVFGSMTYVLVKIGNHYVLTISTAIACMVWSIGLSYAAVCSNNYIVKRILYVLSAILCVLVFESRPSSIILLIGAVAPLFIFVLINQSRSIVSRMIDVAAYIVPILVGGIVIMYYNYLRFDNIFEFGLTYQLTVRDISYDTFRFTPRKIMNAIYSFFFRPLKPVSQFPYFTTLATRASTNGNFFYEDPAAGIFALPFAWGVFSLPYMKLNEAKLEKITYISMLCSAVFLSVFDYLMAGIIQRYYSEIALIIMLVAGMTLINKIKTNEKWSSILFVLLSLATIIAGIVFIVVSESFLNYNSENFAFLLKMSEFFSIR